MTIRFPLALCLGLAAAGVSAADVPAPGDTARAERRAQFEARFTAADADRDGRLDRVEAEAAGSHLVRFFDRLDADADGELTREELAAAHGRRGHRGHGGFAFFAGLVKGMDDDGDGAISRAELGTKMPIWSDAFTTIDANADGRLERDELRAHARARHGLHEGRGDGHRRHHGAEPDRG